MVHESWDTTTNPFFAASTFSLTRMSSGRRPHKTPLVTARCHHMPVQYLAPDILILAHCLRGAVDLTMRSSPKYSLLVQFSSVVRLGVNTSAVRQRWRTHSHVGRRQAVRKRTHSQRCKSMDWASERRHSGFVDVDHQPLK